MTSAPRVLYFWIRRIRLALSRDYSFACTLLCCTLLLAAFSALCGAAQTVSRVRPRTELALLPNDPSFSMDLPGKETSSSSEQSGTPGQPQQTRRILGIMPNFSAVSADVYLPPQSPKEKFIMAAKNSFDYSSFFIAGILSGISMASNSYPEFHQGAAGYGRYYYHTLLDTADSNFMVAGVWPVVFRQDNRYYTLGHGGAAKRALYAVSRVLITRSDNGGRTLNTSEIIGTGSAAGISTLYYPDKYTRWTKVGQRWLASCIVDSVNFTLKEFWPDINRKFFHTK